MSLSLTGNDYSIPGVGKATCTELVDNYCDGKNSKEVLWEFTLDRQCSEETTPKEPSTTKSSEQTTPPEQSTTKSTEQTTPASETTSAQPTTKTPVASTTPSVAECICRSTKEECKGKGLFYVDQQGRRKACGEGTQAVKTLCTGACPPSKPRFKIESDPCPLPVSHYITY